MDEAEAEEEDGVALVALTPVGYDPQYYCEHIHMKTAAATTQDETEKLLNHRKFDIMLAVPLPSLFSTHVS